MKANIEDTTNRHAPEGIPGKAAPCSESRLSACSVASSAINCFSLSQGARLAPTAEERETISLLFPQGRRRGGDEDANCSDWERCFLVFVQRCRQGRIMFGVQAFSLFDGELCSPQAPLPTSFLTPQPDKVDKADKADIFPFFQNGVGIVGFVGWLLRFGLFCPVFYAASGLIEVLTSSPDCRLCRFCRLSLKQSNY